MTHNWLFRLAAVLFFYGTCYTASLAQNTGNNSLNQQPVDFNEFFTPQTLRIDYIMAGDAKGETVYLTGMKQEPFWGGSQKNLLDGYNSGSFRYEVIDSASGRLIYSKGFCNLFQEWQGTKEAKTTRKAFEQTALMPFPKTAIIFRLLKRNYADGKFLNIFELPVKPTDYFIYREKPKALPYVKFKDSGDPATKVDVAFIAEGYLPEEMPKFLQDAQRIGNYFLTVRPYSEYPANFNFYAIEAPSEESGVNIPGTGVYVNTNVHSSFYTFDMDRYLTSFETYKVHDIAANVPYDVIFILVNSKRYGGGGFYNHFGESTVDNPLSQIVSIHEFGHTFAGLADEYYTSEVTYSDFYSLSVEPWEPNITTNTDFASKWKDMVKAGIPLPTPREEQYKEEVGMFEGGGYVGKGIYSPKMDCRMKSNEAPGFCPVCQEAIRRMILYYSE